MAMREGEGMLQMPSILYGTAWKKESTAALVEAAVLQGFRGIDTACQPKHYNEAGVGEGWSRAAASLALDREDFFLQTKYTPIDGQDPERVPYDSSAPLGEQVKESIAVSLANLRTSFVDSLVLHSPLRGDLERTLEVWAALEDTVKEGKARMIGISNCYDLELLKSLCERVNILPAVVQNRFYATSGFDTDLRAFCTAKGIQYQSFWTLTGNREALQGPAVAKVASDVGLSPQQTMFAFVRALGIVPLSGTQSEQHMREDLEVIALCSAESERQQQEQEEEEEGGGGAGAGGGGGRGERGERGETGVLSALQMQDMAAALGVTLPPPPSDAPAGS